MEGYRSAGSRPCYRTARGFVRAFRRAGYRSMPEACEASFAGHGRPVQWPENFDVALVAYPHAGKLVQSPGFYHGGMWHVRGEGGALVLLHEAFEGSPQLYRMTLRRSDGLTARDGPSTSSG